jgi:hypothetical protein
MVTGNQAKLNIQISWLEMGMTPGREVPPMESNSTMATLVRKCIRISLWEMVYELVSGEETFQTLGVEILLLEGQSTMATWTLARDHIENSRVEKSVYESASVRGMIYELVSLMETLKTLGVGEKSSVTAWAWRTSLDVSDFVCDPTWVLACLMLVTSAVESLLVDLMSTSPVVPAVTPLSGSVLFDASQRVDSKLGSISREEVDPCRSLGLMMEGRCA